MQRQKQENEDILLDSGIQNCSREPIHLLGRIQPYGLVLLFKYQKMQTKHSEHHFLRTLMVSNNSKFYQWEPKELVGKKTMMLIPDRKEQRMLMKRILKMRKDHNSFSKDDDAMEDEKVENNENDLRWLQGEADFERVFHLFNRNNARKVRMKCSIAYGPSAEGDMSYKTIAMHATLTTADGFPEDHFILEMEPVKAFKSDKEDGMVQLQRLVSSFNACTSVQEICDLVVQGWFEMSKYDRVMVYKFDARYDGQVISECRRSTDMNSFLGLMFPHTDVPAQARALYVRNIVRFIANVSDEECHFTPPYLLGHDGRKHHIDLRSCALRGSSKLHLEYLSNMGVIATLVSSLVVNGRLWGMLVCHNESSPFVPSLHLRKVCELLSLAASVRLEASLMEQEVQIMMVGHKLTSELNLLGLIEFFSKNKDKILNFTSCTSLILMISNDESEQNQYHQFGPSVNLESAKHTAVVLRSINQKELSYTDNIESIAKHMRKSTAMNNSRPSGEYENGDEDQGEYTPCGACLITVGKYSIMFLRKESVEAINWAGAPQKGERKTIDGVDYLAPRNSFQKVIELRKGFSVSWGECELKFITKIKEQVVLYAHQEYIVQQKQKGMELEEQRNLAYKVAEQKSSFLAHMSHELRTPFNGMIGMLSLLKETNLNEEQLEYTEQAYSCSASMLEILDDVLLATKDETDQMQLRNVWFDMLNVLLSVHKLMKVRATQIEIELKLLIDGVEKSLHQQTTEETLQPWVVGGDPGRLRQILLNLLGNALKFTIPGGEIRLEVQKVQTHKQLRKHLTELREKWSFSSETVEQFIQRLTQVETQELWKCNEVEAINDEEDNNARSKYVWLFLSVCDNGVGMDEEGTTKIFQPFTQLTGSGGSNSHMKKYQGTGLGLPICQKLVENMQGGIIVMSTPSKGSFFGFAVALKYVGHEKSLVPEQVPPNQCHAAQPQETPSCVPSQQMLSKPDQSQTSLPQQTIDGMPQAKAGKDASDPESGPSKVPPSSKSQCQSQGKKLHVTFAEEEQPEKRLILVAEDHRVNQKVIRSMINRLKRYTVEISNNGQEAVDFTLQNHSKITCILMDLHMPELDGIGAACEIRKFELERGLRKLPIIALTADVLDNTRKRCMDADMDDFATKPINLDKLATILKKYESS